MRVCSIHGCPTIYPTIEGTHCAAHRKAADASRGRRQARGYENTHDKLRAQWAPLVSTGRVNCARCGEPISPTEPWDLGHDDTDRTKYNGPEHAGRCNRSAGGRAAHT